ncbi:MAG: tetratricopeptide repeat protein [Leptolyngbya sp.]|nr:tetratricopeptide repeat protein [Candidatus Melainabacteria bacterium]
MANTQVTAEIQRLSKLSEQCSRSGDYMTVYCCSKRILDLVESEPTTKKEELAQKLFDLGLICTALDYTPEAERCLTRALTIYKSLFGDEHKTVTDTRRFLEKIQPEVMVKNQTHRKQTSFTKQMQPALSA